MFESCHQLFGFDPTYRMMRNPVSAKAIRAAVLGIVLFLGAIAFTHTATTTSHIHSPQAAYTLRSQPLKLAQSWVVNASEAKALIDQGATLLDARGNQWFGFNRLPGSVPVRWQDFSPSNQVRKGTLLKSDAALNQKLRKLGISQERPVVVFANPPQGWGEEGRIVWMLRSLGHPQAVMVDGGYSALEPLNLTAPDISRQREFEIQRTPTWQIQKAELKAALDQPDVVLIDTRTPKEYAGATPYGEKRRGHVPGAISLHFQDLLTPQGMLLPREQIVAILADLGITQETEVVAYCTGGIRSGWLTVVLTDLGFRVKNYAGSMWEWSAGSPVEYPLTVQSQVVGDVPQ